MKLMTLNLWCYYDWENRKDSIVSLVREHDPDVIALQEVQTNFAFAPNPQSDFIADACGYKYRSFSPTYSRKDQIDTNGDRTQRTSYGRAVISKYPIVSSEGYVLEQYPDHDEANSVLFCNIEMDGTYVELCCVHFANSDKHSELHLKELLEVCKAKDRRPIMLGDFNNFNLGAYKETLLAGYTISTDLAQYTSMPKDDGTLDYIVVPASEYTLSNVVCPNVYVSDHRALIAKLN